MRISAEPEVITDDEQDEEDYDEEDKERQFQQYNSKINEVSYYYVHDRFLTIKKNYVVCCTPTKLCPCESGCRQPCLPCN